MSEDRTELQMNLSPRQQLIFAALPDTALNLARRLKLSKSRVYSDIKALQALKLVRVQAWSRAPGMRDAAIFGPGFSRDAVPPPQQPGITLDQAMQRWLK